MKNHSVVPLDKSIHQAENFDCGVPVLNIWLHTTAGQHQSKGLSRSYVMTPNDAPQNVAGYYALAIRQFVETSTLPPEFAKRLPAEVPALTLARLAISNSLKRQGYGELLLFDAMLRAKDASNIIGGQFLFVDAKDEIGAGFYKQYGFLPLPQTPLTLAIPMSRIA